MNALKTICEILPIEKERRYSSDFESICYSCEFMGIDLIVILHYYEIPENITPLEI